MHFSAKQDWRIIFGWTIFIVLSVARTGSSHLNDFGSAVQGQTHEHFVGEENPIVFGNKTLPVNGEVEVNGERPSVSDADVLNKLKAVAKDVGLTESQADRIARSIGLDESASVNVNGGIGHQSGKIGQLFSAKRFCGFSPKVDPSRLSNAAPGQYPWSVAILSNTKNFLCSGTLVSESVVVTTASCILRYRSKSNQPLLVILGAWSLPEGYEYMPELEIYASAAVLNPSYNQNLNYNTPGNAQNNIALLRLVQNVDFDMFPHIFPICLIDSSLEQQAGINRCQVLGWPDLPEVQTWRTRAYLASGEVQVVKQGCASHPDSGPCAQGSACVGNEGSTVQCLANSNRYFQWGMIVSEPNCNKGSTVSVAIVNLIQHYDFISQYLWTPNPNPQRPRDTLGPIIIDPNNLNYGEANVIRVPAGGAAVLNGVDNPNVVQG